MQEFKHDVCVIGTGRVGLPLALSLMEVGLNVTGLDVDTALIAAVDAGEMPFLEPGYDALIAKRQLKIHQDPEIVASSRALIITVGTPLHNHIETDLSQLQRVLSSLLPHLRVGQLVCLRSTVAPGTTTFVRRFLAQKTGLEIGAQLRVAFCPERIAEGKAYEELRTLPQIIGTQDDESRAAAAALFEPLAPELLHTDYVSAELVKLFNNIARYVHFAVANQFALIADDFDANIYEIRRMANYKYPRSSLATPGFTAGTCLRKDFGMINEWSPYPDMLLSAWKMNEYIPAFMVAGLQKRVPLYERPVAMLGYTFKKDTDDTRDSLAPKLYRYIQRALPSWVRVSDHHLPAMITQDSGDQLKNWPVEEALDGAECVFVAANHTGYDDALRAFAARNPEAWIADLWNVTEADKIFYQAKTLLETT